MDTKALRVVQWTVKCLVSTPESLGVKTHVL